MGMFGFLKKKPDEAMPSAPETPDVGVTPPLDLPDIKLGGMDEPPAPTPEQDMAQPMTAEPEMPDPTNEPMPEMPSDPMPDPEPMPEMPSDPMPDPTNEPIPDMPSESMPDMPGEPMPEPEEPDTIEPIKEDPVPAEPMSETVEPSEPEAEYEPEPIEPLQLDTPEPEVGSEDTLPGDMEMPEVDTPDGNIPDIEAPTIESPEEYLNKEEEKLSLEPETTPTRRVINHSLFINVDEFRSIASIIAGLSDDAKSAEETLFRIKDVALGREKVFDKWQTDLELVERELIQLDKMLFNV